MKRLLALSLLAAAFTFGGALIGQGHASADGGGTGGVPASKDDCKNNGWQNLVRDDKTTRFKNQGDCVSYIATKPVQVVFQ